MARYSIKSVSLSPPHFKWATTRMRLRASLHRVFSTLMCFLNERCESHHSPRNFVDSSTGRCVFPILTMGGLWARARGAVKCTTLHLWAANLKPFLVAHSSMAFTACCRCLSMVSRERPLKQRWDRPIRPLEEFNGSPGEVSAVGPHKAPKSHLVVPHKHNWGRNYTNPVVVVVSILNQQGHFWNLTASIFTVCIKKLFVAQSVFNPRP